MLIFFWEFPIEKQYNKVPLHSLLLKKPMKLMTVLIIRTYFQQWYIKNRAWTSAAPFLASVTRAPLNFTNKSTRSAPFTKIGARKRKVLSFSSDFTWVTFLETALFLHFFTVSLNFQYILNIFYCIYSKAETKIIFERNLM